MAYCLPQAGNRITFMLPYYDGCTIIGTTEKAFTGDLRNVCVEPDEVDAICDAVNSYLATPICPKDIIHTWSGVRPLVANTNQSLSAITRDYRLEKMQLNQATLINVWGGKLTTHRHLAEKAINQLRDVFPNLAQPWTQTQPLPGGDLGTLSFEQFKLKLKQQYGFLPADPDNADRIEMWLPVATCREIAEPETKAFS